MGLLFCEECQGSFGLWGQTSLTYAGFDRFERVTQQLWTNGGDVDKYTYGYDPNSNRQWKHNTTTSLKDEYYNYDNLNRLKDYSRGTLTGGSPPTGINTSTDVRKEAWGLSPTGHWSQYQVDNDSGIVDEDFTDAGDLNQTRTPNKVNEVTGISEDNGQSAWENPAYDARGNMKVIPKPNALNSSYSAVYDSWNRLATLSSGGTLVGKYEYDGLNRRIKSHIDTPGSPVGVDTYRHFYYNSGWQILETRDSNNENTAPEGLNPVYQYVWSARYIDAPILRDENQNADGDCTDYPDEDDQRLYYLTDANMNVTTLVNVSGGAEEHYLYDPYGKVNALGLDWSTDRGAGNYSTSILYCGYYRDQETGLYHVRHRTYHPYLGTWITRDKIEYGDGMSLYEVLRTAPTTELDPSGLATVTVSTDPGWYDGHLPDVRQANGKVKPYRGYTYIYLQDRSACVCPVTRWRIQPADINVRVVIVLDSSKYTGTDAAIDMYWDYGHEQQHAKEIAIVVALMKPKWEQDLAKIEQSAQTWETQEKCDDRRPGLMQPVINMIVRDLAAEAYGHAGEQRQVQTVPSEQQNPKRTRAAGSVKTEEQGYPVDDPRKHYPPSGEPGSSKGDVSTIKEQHQVPPVF